MTYLAHAGPYMKVIRPATSKKVKAKAETKAPAIKEYYESDAWAFSKCADQLDLEYRQRFPAP